MITQIAQHWRMKGQRYQLSGYVCPKCQTKSLQAQHVCTICTAEKPEPSGYLAILPQPVNNPDTGILVQFPQLQYA